MSTTEIGKRLPQWQAWLLASRPKTLTASLIPVLVGTSLAQGSFDIAFFSLLTAICIQIGTNLVNDALDFKKGTDTTERLGPQRMTQSGQIPMEVVLRGGAVTFALALLCALPLILKGGWPIAILLFIAIGSGYFYTGGPYPLSYLGLGDPFVLFFYGPIATAAVYFLQSGTFSIQAILAGFQIGLLALVLLAINNLRDCRGDSLAGKQTIPVRFGLTVARIEITLAIILPFILNIFWLSSYQLAFLLPYLTLPIAIRLLKNVWKVAPSRAYNNFLGQAALLHCVFGLLLALGTYI